MSTAFADPALSAITSIVFKASILLGLAAVAQLMLRTRASAAARHLVWTVTICALLLLPLLSVALPAWAIVTRGGEMPTTLAALAPALGPVVDPPIAEPLPIADMATEPAGIERSRTYSNPSDALG